MKRVIITLDIKYNEHEYSRPDSWNFSELFDCDKKLVSVISIQDKLPTKEINHVS
jgi:hypothetical protein